MGVAQAWRNHGTALADPRRKPSPTRTGAADFLVSRNTSHNFYNYLLKLINQR